MIYHYYKQQLQDYYWEKLAWWSICLDSYIRRKRRTWMLYKRQGSDDKIIYLRVTHDGQGYEERVER